MRPGLVPELICSDIERSRDFYVRVLGFIVQYERPDERFACLERQGVELMLEQPVERGRLYPDTPLEHPFGRGVNFEIRVSAVGVLHDALASEGFKFYLPLEERWYGREADEIGVRQFAVQDPDGYLLRFSETIGTRRQAQS